jgi:hypothetical protein
MAAITGKPHHEVGDPAPTDPLKRTAQRLCYAELAQQRLPRREHLPDLGKAQADKFVGGRSLLDFCGAFMLRYLSLYVKIKIDGGGFLLLFRAPSVVVVASAPLPQRLYFGRGVRVLRVNMRLTTAMRSIKVASIVASIGRGNKCQRKLLKLKYSQ